MAAKKPKYLQAEFFHACETQLGFLQQNFGFKRAKKETIAVLYSWEACNDTTAFCISLDRRDQMIDAVIIRLVGGRIPPRFTHSEGKFRENRRDYLSLNVIANSRDSAILATLTPEGYPLISSEVNRIVKLYVIILKTFAVDLLLGDFSKMEQFTNKIV